MTIIKQNKIFRQLGIYLIGLLLISPLFFWLDEKDLNKITHAHLWPILLYFLFTVTLHFVDSLRWKAIQDKLLNNRICSVTKYFIIYSFSLGLGQFVSQLGGLFIARPAIMKDRYGVPYHVSVLTTFIEKTADMLFLGILLINSIIFFFYDFNFLTTLIILILSLSIGYVMYISLGIYLETLFIKIFSILSRNTNKKKIYLQILESNKKGNRINYPLIGVFSILRYIPLYLRLICIIWAFSIVVPPFVLLFGLPISQLALIFSITPGALGFLEGGWLAVFQLADISKDITSSFLIGQRAVLIFVSSIILLLIFFLTRKKPLKRRDLVIPKSKKLD